MGKLGKRARDIREKIDPVKLYAIDDAVTLLSELSSVKFTESIDVSINLGVDPKKSDQVVRGSTVLPNGTGKDVRVAVFAQGDKADEAQNAGADVRGHAAAPMLPRQETRAVTHMGRRGLPLRTCSRYARRGRTT